MEDDEQTAEAPSVVEPTTLDLHLVKAASERVTVTCNECGNHTTDLPDEVLAWAVLHSERRGHDDYTTEEAPHPEPDQ